MTGTLDVHPTWVSIEGREGALWGTQRFRLRNGLMPFFWCERFKESHGCGSLILHLHLLNIQKVDFKPPSRAASLTWASVSFWNNKKVVMWGGKKSAWSKTVLQRGLYALNAEIWFRIHLKKLLLRWLMLTVSTSCWEWFLLISVPNRWATHHVASGGMCHRHHALNPGWNMTDCCLLPLR